MHYLRAFALIGVLGFLFLAAGCSGQSSATPPISGQQQGSIPVPSTDNVSSDPTRTTMSTTSTITVTGTVISADNAKFTVKTTSPSCGEMYFYYSTSGTKFYPYLGYPIKAGMPIQATGTGTCSNYGSLQAGTITYLNAATPPPNPSSATPTPTATPVPVSSVPKHVQTGEYLTTTTEESTSPSVYAPYLTWAYALYSRLGITQAAGIKTVLYTSPIMPNYGAYEETALRSYYPGSEAKTCTGATITSYSGNGLLSDPTTSSYSAYLTNVVDHYISAAESANPGYSHPWNLIFIDNDGPLYKTSATPCDFNLSTWTSDQDRAMSATGQQFILNGLSVSSTNVTTYVNRLAGSEISGGEFEMCFNSSLWEEEEDSQLQTIALLKSEGKGPSAGWWCYLSDTTTSGASSIPQRLYAYASFLLTYNPNYSVYEESFTTTPSNFKVFPETGFVPLNPVSVPTSITGLATSTGAYEQRYSSCYYRGSYLGECEIIVNPSTTSYVSVPNPWGLHHSMVLSGGGVLDGGSTSFSGGVPTSMAPKSGLILTP